MTMPKPHIQRAMRRILIRLEDKALRVTIENARVRALKAGSSRRDAGDHAPLLPVPREGEGMSETWDHAPAGSEQDAEWQ
jgi:hypothetical protein